jgi:hypothetical protein
VDQDTQDVDERVMQNADESAAMSCTESVLCGGDGWRIALSRLFDIWPFPLVVSYSEPIPPARNAIVDKWKMHSAKRGMAAIGGTQRLERKRLRQLSLFAVVSRAR